MTGVQTCALPIYIAVNQSSAAYHNEELRLGLPQDNARSKNIEEWYRSRNEKKKYQYFDSDKWVGYGTSIGNTVGNFLPHRVLVLKLLELTKCVK